MFQNEPQDAQQKSDNKNQSKKAIEKMVGKRTTEMQICGGVWRNARALGRIKGGVFNFLGPSMRCKRGKMRAKKGEEEALGTSDG